MGRTPWKSWIAAGLALCLALAGCGAEIDLAEDESDVAPWQEVEEDGGEARAVAQKYLRGKECTKENLYKAFRYLISRGFGYDTAKEAVDFSDDD